MADAATAAALSAGDQLVREIIEAQQPAARGQAPTMGRLKRVSYTHAALIDLIIEHPEWDQKDFAAHFGYTEGWMSNIMASDAFQAALASRKEEVIDPELKATVEERFRGLVIQSIKVLQAKLNQPAVSDQVALRAAELGAKALGIGGNAPPRPPADFGRLERLAERLVTLQSGVRERVLSEKDGVRVEQLREVAGDPGEARSDGRSLQGSSAASDVAGGLSGDVQAD